MLEKKQTPLEEAFFQTDPDRRENPEANLPALISAWYRQARSKARRDESARRSTPPSQAPGQ